MKTALFASLLVAAALALVPAAPSSGDGPPATAPAPEKKLGDLLERLGSKHFKVRQEAERQLSVREEAAPALRRLLTSSDQDLRRRAARILEALAQRANRLEREKLEVLAKQGEIDQVVERLVRRPDWGTEEDAAWQVLAAFAGRLLDLDKTKFPMAAIDKITYEQMIALLSQAARPGPPAPPLPPGTPPPMGKRPTLQEWQSQYPFRDFRRYKKCNRPIIIARARVTLPPRGDSFVIRGEDVCLDNRSRSDLIACTGNVSVTDSLHSGIFAGSSVSLRRVGRSVIVCDGEFKAEVANSCIIIARGPVTIPGGAHGCLIVSASKIDMPKWFRDGKNAQNVLRENEAVPLGFVKFFDPARAGITVVAASKEIAVKAVTPGKPFARAGLRPGDVLLAVDGAAVPSPEAFRQLLRRKLAEGKDATFKLRRDDKTLDIRVPCKD